jgi:pectinesterase
LLPSTDVPLLPFPVPAARTIFIYPGTYKEQIYITRKGKLTIYGYSKQDSTYEANEVVSSASFSF